MSRSGKAATLTGGLPPHWARLVKALGRAHQMDMGPALEVVVGTTGLLGQLKVSLSDTFYIPKRWGVVFATPLTGSLLLRSYYFQLQDSSENPLATPK